MNERRLQDVFMWYDRYFAYASTVRVHMYRVLQKSGLKNGFISPNQLKTWFVLDLVVQGLDKSCKPGLSTKTCQNPALNHV
jgi:hypothetical protein